METKTVDKTIAKTVIVKEVCDLSAAKGDTLVVDYLAQKSGVSKILIKKAMMCGALKIKPAGSGKFRHFRKAKELLKHGDHIEFFFRADLISQELKDEPTLIYKHPRFSVWCKPEGVLAQGNEYGDHLSLQRFVERALGKTFLIHRLDREALGLMIFAHTKEAAADFSSLFQLNRIHKNYLIRVHGKVAGSATEFQSIDLKLDDQEAKTLYKVISSNDQWSELSVRLVTGRLHQIRRHFHLLGHPVIGDYRHRLDEFKDPAGTKLMLAATSLTFTDPYTKKEHKFSVPEETIKKFLVYPQ